MGEDDLSTDFLRKPLLRVSKISTDTIALVWTRPHNGGALIQGACLDHEDGDHGDKDDDSDDNGDHRDNDDLRQRPFYILHLFYEKSLREPVAGFNFFGNILSTK